MKRLTADFIYTNTGAPLQHGCVVMREDGIVTNIIEHDDLDDVQYFRGSLVPGFVNAHCHVELSYLHKKITPNTGLVNFVIELLGKRTATRDDIVFAAQAADDEMLRNGIVCVGDISNSVDSVPVKVQSKLHYHTFIETLGYRETHAQQAFEQATSVYDTFRASRLHASIAPHAPYSMSRGLLGLVSGWYKRHHDVASIHYLESFSEVEFCRDRSGAFNELLAFLRFPPDAFVAYGEDGAACVLKFLTDAERVLLVHNTVANENDIGVALGMLNQNAWLVTCPNANLYIEDQLPDYDAWRKQTTQICIGTDSLASNNALSVWSEMQTVHARYPDIAFDEMLRWATINGATALGAADQFGSIDIGKRPGLVWLEHDANASPFAAMQPVRVA